MNGRTVLTFIAVGIGVLLITIDISSINLALPGIQKDFNIDLGVAQWVVNAYMLAFAIMLVTGGRFADSYGRRKVFFIGLLVFGATSLIGGLSVDPWMVIAARAGQGLGAGLLWPSIIGLMTGAVDESKRGTAVGVLMGAASIGNAIGPLVGGALTQYASWRWTLLLNVPLALLAFAISVKVVAEQRSGDAPERNDFGGMVLLSIGLIALMLALDFAASWGWGSTKTLALIALALVALVLFPIFEAKRQDALVPTEVFKNAGLMASCVAMATTAAPWGLTLLYVPQFAEKFLGYPPVESGMTVVPLMVGFGFLSVISGRLYDRCGAKLVISSGLILTVISSATLALGNALNSPVGLAIALVALGVALGTSIPALTTAAVSAVKSNQASLASGLTFMFQLTGIALSIAVCTAVFSATVTSDVQADLAASHVHVSPAQQAVLGALLMGSESAQGAESGKVRINSLEVADARRSYTDGVQKAVLVSAFMAAIGAVVAVLYVGGPLKRRGTPA